MTAADFIPPGASLEELREASHACRGCDLYQNATQTVFGDGPDKAPLMLVGEQPGDKEDLSGKPFIGPAGRLLDEAFEAAGIDRRIVF
ncbi:MAG TPA: uracil-DNA glycosylase family protein, partial [Actinomycetota bacterium]|nr:uracil-DNA glycosylase family protein [Actinomycetota bacterium]